MAPERKRLLSESRRALNATVEHACQSMEEVETKARDLTHALTNRDARSRTNPFNKIAELPRKKT